MESGKIDLKPERVQLAGVVEDVTSIVAGLARQRDIRIETSVDPDIGEVHLDPNRFKQVLYNYLSNAIKFSPRARRASMCACGLTARIISRVEVEDWGIGIKAEDVNRLFIEFQQLDASTAKRYGGTGLGLSLTKRIVEAQGGAVGVDSEFGVGSTFYAKLPRDVTARIADLAWSRAKSAAPERLAADVLADNRGQLARADRLGHEFHEARFACALDVAMLTVGRDGNDGDVLGRDIFLQAPRQLPAVHPRQLNIHQDERRIDVLQHVKCGHRIDGRDDRKPVGFEQRAREG